MLFFKRQSEAIDDATQNFKQFRDAIMSLCLVDKSVKNVVDLLANKCSKTCNKNSMQLHGSPCKIHVMYLRICHKCDAKLSLKSRAREGPRSRTIPKVAGQTFGQCASSPGTAGNPGTPGNVGKIHRRVAGEARPLPRSARLLLDRIRHRSGWWRAAAYEKG